MELPLDYEDGIPVVDLLDQAVGIRRLLVKIIRIAALDWVMYKDSEKPQDVRKALDAYFWLFEEKPGEPAWEERVENGYEVTAFLSICEALELDPDALRQGILSMPPERARVLEREPAGRERPPDFAQMHRGEVRLDRNDIYDVCTRADFEGGDDNSDGDFDSSLLYALG